MERLAGSFPAASVSLRGGRGTRRGFPRQNRLQLLILRVGYPSAALVHCGISAADRKCYAESGWGLPRGMFVVECERGYHGLQYLILLSRPISTDLLC